MFEVEDPDDAGEDAAERLIRERRVRFWSACGAQLLAAPGYVLPDYTGSGLTEPMLLMAATAEGAAGAAGAAPAVTGDQLRSLVLAIYADRYGLGERHPLVARALVSISG